MFELATACFVEARWEQVSLSKISDSLDQNSVQVLCRPSARKQCWGINVTFGWPENLSGSDWHSSLSSSSESWIIDGFIFLWECSSTCIWDLVQSLNSTPTKTSHDWSAFATPPWVSCKSIVCKAFLSYAAATRFKAYHKHFSYTIILLYNCLLWIRYCVLEQWLIHELWNSVWRFTPCNCHSIVWYMLALSDLPTPCCLCIVITSFIVLQIARQQRNGTQCKKLRELIKII